MVMVFHVSNSAEVIVVVALAPSLSTKIRSAGDVACTVAVKGPARNLELTARTLKNLVSPGSGG